MTQINRSSMGTNGSVVPVRATVNSKKPEYWVWVSMRRRCSDVTSRYYDLYGGRGIRVCDRWRLSFVSFLADMGHRPSPLHSIDRIDNDGDYEPGNCRWATRLEQANNTRRSVRLTLNGETRTIAEWAMVTGLPYALIYDRTQRYGWAPARALSEPESLSGKPGSSSRPLTKRQRDVLVFVESFLASHGYPPTNRDVCAEFGWASKNAAAAHMSALRHKGFIAIDPGVARGIRILKGAA